MTIKIPLSSAVLKEKKNSMPFLIRAVFTPVPGRPGGKKWVCLINYRKQDILELLLRTSIKSGINRMGLNFEVNDISLTDESWLSRSYQTK
jgi:hypothetical protein